MKRLEHSQAHSQNAGWLARQKVVVMREPVSLEQRRVELRVAENQLGYVARAWLMARVRGHRGKLRKLDAECDAAQQEVRRAARRLRDAEKREAGR